MLGHKLYQVLGRDLDVWGTVRGVPADLAAYSFFDRDKIVGGVDAAEIETLARALDNVSPDVVINAIGAVKQRHSGTDPAQARVVNSIFPHKVAELTRERGARFISISTDCVFSGTKGGYSESDIPDATDVYGSSKRLGEPSGRDVLILRTSLIGRELNRRHGLVEWFLSNRGLSVSGYVKAVFSGLTTLVFARLLGELLENHPDLDGLYHVSSQPISKHDLLVALDDAFATGTHIEPSNDIAIDRSLDSSRFRVATGWHPPSWDEMVHEMASDPTFYV